MSEINDFYNILQENIKQCSEYIERKKNNKDETFLESNQLVNILLQKPTLYKDKEEARKMQLNKISDENKEELEERIKFQNKQAFIEEKIAQTIDYLLTRGL